MTMTREEYLAKKRAYYQAHKKEYADYVKANRARINEYCRKKRAEDPEKFRERERAWRAKNIEKCREYNRKYQASEKYAINYERYYSEHKEEFFRRAKKSMASHQDEVIVRRKLYNAIKSGKITKGKCVVCGAEKVDAHHLDYNKPFDVVWMCRRHHIQWHRENEVIRKQ